MKIIRISFILFFYFMFTVYLYADDTESTDYSSYYSTDNIDQVTTDTTSTDFNISAAREDSIIGPVLLNEGLVGITTSPTSEEQKDLLVASSYVLELPISTFPNGPEIESVSMGTGPLADWVGVVDSVQKGYDEGKIDLGMKSFEEKVTSLSGEEKIRYLRLGAENYFAITNYDYSELNLPSNQPANVFYTTDYRLPEGVPKGANGYNSPEFQNIIIDPQNVKKEIPKEKELISNLKEGFSKLNMPFNGLGVANLTDQELFKMYIQDTLNHEAGHLLAFHKASENEATFGYTTEKAAFETELMNSAAPQFLLASYIVQSNQLETRGALSLREQQYLQALKDITKENLQEAGYLDYVTAEKIKATEKDWGRALNEEEKERARKEVQEQGKVYYKKDYQFYQYDFIQSTSPKKIRSITRNNYELVYGKPFSSGEAKIPQEVLDEVP